MLIIFFILLIIILFSWIAYYISERILRIKISSEEQLYDYGIKNFPHINENEFNNLNYKTIDVKTSHGYSLPIDIYMSEKPGSSKFIIICHGVTSSKTGSSRYMMLLRKLGYNCVIYSHKRHGENEHKGKYTTYGMEEKIDLKYVIESIKNKFIVEKIGLYGFSMGAITILEYGGTYNDVDFYIADCPVSKLNDQIAYRLKIENKLPRFPFMHLGSIATKLRAGFFFKDIDTIKSISKITKPVLLIQTKGDNYVPPQMTIDLYNAPLSGGWRELKMFEEGDHTEAYLKNKDEYIKIIDDFLKKI